MSRRATIFWLAVLLLGLAQAGPVSGRAPARRPPPLLPGTTSVLWVAAHPDDEVLVAPLLAASAWTRDSLARSSSSPTGSRASACCRAAADPTSRPCVPRR